MAFRPRILAHGPPNHGKTKAIVNTFPRPMFILNSPGERGGYGSLPVGDPEVVVYPDIDPTLKSEVVLAQVKHAYLEAIKSGKYQTIAFEGLHKLMDYAMDVVTGGDYFQGLKPDWNTFGLCYHYVDRMLDTLLINNVPAVIVTCWSKEKGERKIKKGEKVDDIPQTVGPDLLGEYARKVVGGFQMVFAQTLRPFPDKRTDKEGRRLQWAAWQTRPTQSVQGCGIKGPDKIVENIPLFIPADYRYLKQIWEELDK